MAYKILSFQKGHQDIRMTEWDHPQVQIVTNFEVLVDCSDKAPKEVEKTDPKYDDYVYDNEQHVDSIKDQIVWEFEHVEAKDAENEFFPDDENFLGFKIDLSPHGEFLSIKDLERVKMTMEVMGYYDPPYSAMERAIDHIVDELKT